MRYVFQLSKIWEGGENPLDPSQPEVSIKAPAGSTEARARRRLKQAPLGRKWILVRTEGKA